MQRLSLIRRISQMGTILFTLLHGKKVGQDQFGNVYFRARRTPKNMREKRWVMYAGEIDASLVPPEWHIWLHHTADAPLDKNDSWHQKWQRAYVPNMTGTASAYRAPGHILAMGRRPKATGDYQAWVPDL